MAFYRKKPVVIEARRVGYETYKSLIEWSGAKPIVAARGKVAWLVIETLEGDMRADIGDYIIKGVNGEFYPCKADIFDKTYEAISESSSRE